MPTKLAGTQNMQINIKYGVDSISRNVSDNSTIGSIIGDSNVKAVLGYGDNVRVLLNGVALDQATRVHNGDTLVIETAANRKAAPDVSFTVRYGVDSVTRSRPGPVTVGDILSDRNLKAVLGYGDNVRVLISGVEQPLDAGIPNGASLTIETRANTKAN